MKNKISIREYFNSHFNDQEKLKIIPLLNFIQDVINEQHRLFNFPIVDMSLRHDTKL